MTTFAFLGAFVFAWPRKGVKRSDKWTEPKSQARQICCSSDVRTGEMWEGLAVKHRRYQISGRETPSSKCGGAKLIDDFRWVIRAGDTKLNWLVVAVSIALVGVPLASGLWLFRRTERTFTDVI